MNHVELKMSTGCRTLIGQDDSATVYFHFQWSRQGARLANQCRGQVARRGQICVWWFMKTTCGVTHHERVYKVSELKVNHSYPQILKMCKAITIMYYKYGTWTLDNVSRLGSRVGFRQVVLWVRNEKAPSGDLPMTCIQWAESND